MKIEKLGPLLMCLTLAISGCEKPQPKAAMAARVQDAPSSPWKLERQTDTMTDVVHNFLVTSDPATNAVFHIFCNPGNNIYMFTSDLFLGSTGTYGEIEYRFDNGKSSRATVFIDKQIAIFGSPVSQDEWVRTSGDKWMTALNGWEFGIELALKSHKRLRVRLKSFDGDQRDLDFNVTGVGEKMQELAVACGKPRDSVGY